MNNRTLIDITADLQDFQNTVLHIRQDKAAWYDAHLKIPTWQKTNSEDYANEVLAEIAKFAAHAKMLEQGSELIPDETINKNVLTDVSTRLIDHIELYVARISQEQKSRYQQLLSDLKNIQRVLQKVPQKPKLGNP